MNTTQRPLARFFMLATLMAQTVAASFALASSTPKAPDAALRQNVLGLWVSLEAKPGQEESLANFLRAGRALAAKEPDTASWFAVQLSQSRFAIFDTFPNESGRAAHLSGNLAAGLMAQAPTLLAQAPSIERFDVLAIKLPRHPAKQAARKNALGLWVSLEAKPEKAAELARFLESGRALAVAEPATTTWYAVRFSDTRFAIFDTFPDEAGRAAHLAGKVAEALMQQAPELLAQAPSIEKTQVLAVKLPK
jgi:quinol monooxygenase YgiN